jgi:hypothetical protein
MIPRAIKGKKRFASERRSRHQTRRCINARTRHAPMLADQMTLIALMPVHH